MHVKTANKETLLSTKTATLQVQFNKDLIMPVEFRVVPRLNHPVILGMQWLATYNPTIDWSQRTVALKHNNNMHTLPAETSAGKKAPQIRM